jgi:hypothetical protein
MYLTKKGVMFYDIKDYKLLSNRTIFECYKCKKVETISLIHREDLMNLICVDCINIFAPNIEIIKVLKYIGSNNEFNRPKYLVSVNGNNRTMCKYNINRTTLIFAHKLGRVQCPVFGRCFNCVKSGNNLYCASFLKIIREFTQMLVKKIYNIKTSIYLRYCDIYHWNFNLNVFLIINRIIINVYCYLIIIIIAFCLIYVFPVVLLLLIYVLIVIIENILRVFSGAISLVY